MEEKTKFGMNSVYLTFITPEEYEQIENPLVTSVHAFPVKLNEVLFTLNPRGLDIIGGHVELGETNQEALIRECMEEACIKPIKYEIIGAIKVDNRENMIAIDKGYPLIGYQLFYAITKYEEYSFKQTHECVGRILIEKGNVKEKHHKWLNVHQKLLDNVFKII